MGALRLVIVLVAAAAAAIALALVVRHMTARPSVARAATPHPSVRVLVAKHDLQVGQRVQPGDVAWQAWPQGAVNPAFITGGPALAKAGLADKAEQALQSVAVSDPGVQSVNGAMVREAIVANEPMSLRKLVKDGQAGFMAVKLPSGMRAMAVPVTVESGAGGFILPGDHVDVIENIKMGSAGAGGPAQPVESRTVLKNISVLAIDQAIEAKQGASTIVGATATLEVPAADIDLLAKAREEGALQLALRSYADMDGPPGAADAAPVVRRPIAVVARQDPPVRVYRGGKVSEVRVP